MPERVTDFGEVQMEMSQSQFYAYPAKAQELIKAYGRERPQGMGKPSIITFARYRMDEIADAMGDGFPEVTEAMRRMSSLGRKEPQP